MTGRRGYRGYVSSREFGGYRIPVPVQSLALRDYCARHQMPYVLPVNENIFPHSYLVLEGLVKSLDGYEGIVMCSVHMLPRRRERRREIYDRILGQGLTLHLVLEDLVIADAEGAADVEQLFAFAELVQQAPASISFDD